MGYLGVRTAVGVLSANNRVTTPATGWVVTFTPEMMPTDAEFEIWHGATRGPGGYFLVYKDDALFGVGQNGFINEYAPVNAMFVRKGQSVSLHWSTNIGTAPIVWFEFRQPEVGRL
jgi:hypothetical protein